jgi:hypothetical protein
LVARDIDPDGIIHEDPAISVSWLKGIPLEVKKSQGDLLGFIEKLETVESLYSAQTILS